jgi:hypothetical protein
MLYETRNYLRTEEAKTPVSVMLYQWSSVGVPGKISNSIAESLEFWKQEYIYNVLALKKTVRCTWISPEWVCITMTSMNKQFYCLDTQITCLKINYTFRFITRKLFFNNLVLPPKRCICKITLKFF